MEIRVRLTTEQVLEDTELLYVHFLFTEYLAQAIEDKIEFLKVLRQWDRLDGDGKRDELNKLREVLDAEVLLFTIAETLWDPRRRERAYLDVFKQHLETIDLGKRRKRMHHSRVKNIRLLTELLTRIKEQKVELEQLPSVQQNLKLYRHRYVREVKELTETEKREESEIKRFEEVEQQLQQLLDSERVLVNFLLGRMVNVDDFDELVRNFKAELKLKQQLELFEGTVYEELKDTLAEFERLTGPTLWANEKLEELERMHFHTLTAGDWEDLRAETLRDLRGEEPASEEAYLKICDILKNIYEVLEKQDQKVKLKHIGNMADRVREERTLDAVKGYLEAFYEAIRFMK